MLRAYVNNEQDNWDEHLVSLEIAYNNSLQASTGFTPFHMNYLQHPNLPLSEALRHSHQCNNPSAADQIELYHRQIQQATENLKQAQQRQKKYADEHRRDMTLQVGDQSLLSTANLRFLRIDKAPKLLPKFIGPYAVTKVISPTSYESDLPQQLRIHPVFHLDKLKLFKKSLHFPNRVQPLRPPPEVEEDGHEEWEVERILGRRLIKIERGRTRTEYLVHWKGYPDYEDSWQPASNLTNASYMISEYMKNQDNQS